MLSSFHALSRLKGIETQVISSVSVQGYIPFHALSRLKGIETEQC